MNLIRNILSFTLFAVIISGCGGGNTTISPGNQTSNATSGTTSTSSSSIVSGTTSTSTSTSGTSTTSSTTSASGSGSTTGSTSSTGTVTLKWSAPTTRANSTSVSMSEISGYRLYYGPSASDTSNTIQVTDGTATQYSITLPSGTYYFRISAIDTNGNEGLKSTALQKSF